MPTPYLIIIKHDFIAYFLLWRTIRISCLQIVWYLLQKLAIRITRNWLYFTCMHISVGDQLICFLGGTHIFGPFCPNPESAARICPEFARICPKFARNLLEICPNSYIGIFFEGGRAQCLPIPPPPPPSAMQFWIIVLQSKTKLRLKSKSIRLLTQ